MDRRAFLTLAIGAGAAAWSAPALADGKTRFGRFEKKNRYAVSGSVEIVQERDRFVIRTSEDFTFGNAPDPKIALGRNGYDARTLMGPLKSSTGRSSYEVPVGINPNAYDEVWIWCERFNVPLAVAIL